MYHEYYRKLGVKTPHNKVSDDGWINLQLYDIAHIFGPNLMMGKSQSEMPFTDFDLYKSPPQPQ